MCIRARACVCVCVCVCVGVCVCKCVCVCVSRGGAQAKTLAGFRLKTVNYISFMLHVVNMINVIG